MKISTAQTKSTMVSYQNHRADMVPVAGLSHRFSRLNAYMSKLIPAKIGYASHIVKVLRRLTSKKETPETDVSDVSLVPVAGLEPARYR
ncbi:MAG: hypothetical protein IJP05_00505, partial [Oscillospiraceae bacterium]|nr:hypothetical protein [Oscillospiraceae bacterium]